MQGRHSVKEGGYARVMYPGVLWLCKTAEEEMLIILAKKKLARSECLSRLCRLFLHRPKNYGSARPGPSPRATWPEQGSNAEYLYRPR